MNRLSIFDQHDSEATSGMVFGGGIEDIKKQLDSSFQTVDDEMKTESEAMPLPEAEEEEDSETEEEEEEEKEEKMDKIVEENRKLWQAIDKLKAKCAEEMKKNMEIEERVRNEVCTAMQKQIIELENTYKNRLAYEHALQEERHEHRLDIIVASIKRTKKRKHVFGGDESEEGEHAEVENISVARQLEEERTLRQSVEEKCAEMSERVGQLEREVDSLRADRNSLLASKTSLGDQLTQAEFQLAAERESMQTKIRELETYIKQLNDANFIKENALQRSRATVEALETETKSLAEKIATSEKKVEEKERELFEARESLSVAAEAQQRLHDINLSLSARLEEHGVVANDLQAQIQTLKTTAESDAASESARQKELEAELERRTKQLEKDLAEAATEKSLLQEALDVAEAAVKENELAVAQRAGELERLTGELERLASVVEQERTSSSDLRAELEQQRQQLAARNAEAAVDAQEKQTQLEAKLNSLQEQHLITNYAKESVSSTTDVESRSLSVTLVDSAQEGRSRRQPRKQAAAAVLCDTDPDIVGPSPVAHPSRPRRNRRPKNFSSQDDDCESDSKLSAKENIDIKSVMDGSALESDSNETEEPHLVSPPHSPLPKGRPRRHLLKAVQDEQFCASPFATPDDLFKDRTSSHDTVLKSLRTRNRKH